MKSLLKVWGWFCLISVFLWITQGTFLDVKQPKQQQKQQKHFLTLQSRPLYLSKSLQSRQHLHLPFTRLFSISSSLSSYYASNSLVTFSPTTVKLSPSKRSTFIDFQDKKSNQQNKPLFGRQIIASNVNAFMNQSVLNDLRTPFPTQITEIVFVNEGFLFLFVFPAKVYVMEEMHNSISIKTSYVVEEFNVKFGQEKDKNQNLDQLYLTPETISFYPLANSYVIGHLEESNEIFLFDKKSYFWLKNDANITNLEHIHTFDSKGLQFFTAQRENGFKHCQINLATRKIQLIRKFELFDDIHLKMTNQVSKNQQRLQIYDVSFNSDSQEIYVLDINLGVIKFKYFPTKVKNNQKDSETYKIVQNSTVILIKQRGCQALDYIHNDRIVLICEDRKRRFFVEAYYNSHLNLFAKQEPVFHNCNFEDLEITDEFYVAFQQSSIDIFWPSRFNFIPELVHNKKHINLLGLQAFKIASDQKGNVFLYSIRNNIVIKEKLEEEKYSLSVGSSEPIRKAFTLEAFGSCSMLYMNLNDQSQKFSVTFPPDEITRLNQKMSQQPKSQQKQTELCLIKVPIDLETSRYIFQNRGKFSLAIGILVICVLIAFTLVCICMKKYTGMQRTAQETLLKLKGRQTINPQFVL